jgi:hypothetical protein
MIGAHVTSVFNPMRRHIGLNILQIQAYDCSGRSGEHVIDPGARSPLFTLPQGRVSLQRLWCLTRLFDTLHALCPLLKLTTVQPHAPARPRLTKGLVLRSPFPPAPGPAGSATAVVGSSAGDDPLSTALTVVKGDDDDEGSSGGIGGTSSTSTSTTGAAGGTTGTTNYGSYGTSSTTYGSGYGGTAYGGQCVAVWENSGDTVGGTGLWG